MAHIRWIPHFVFRRDICLPHYVQQGALVYFMQTGFAMLTAGSIRAKNVKNVLLWNFLDSCGGGIAFWITGYAFAYGGDNDDDDGGKTFIGSSDFFLRNDGVNFEGIIYERTGIYYVCTHVFASYEFWLTQSSLLSSSCTTTNYY